MPGPVATAFVELRVDASKLGPQIVQAAKTSGQQAGNELDRGLSDGARRAGSNVATILKSKFAAIAGIGGAFTALFGAMTASGHSLEEATKRLELSIEGSGQAFDTYESRIAAAIDRGITFGRTNVQVADALVKLNTRLNDPAKALQGLELAFNIAAISSISFGAAVNRAGLIMSGQPKVFKLYGITLTSAKVAQTQFTAAQEAHAKASETLKAATQRLSDTEALQGQKRGGPQASQTRALANAEKNLAEAREDAARDGAERIADAEQNLLDVRERIAESTRLSTADTRRLRDAQQDLDKAYRSRDREQYLEATERLSDVQEDLGEKQKVTAADQRALADAEKAVAEAKIESAEQGAQRIAAAEEALLSIRESLADQAQGSLSDEFALRDARQAVADAQAAEAQTAAEAAAAKTTLSGANKALADAQEEVNKRVSKGEELNDGFIGRLLKIKTAVQNQINLFGQKYGPALTGASAALGAVGSAATITNTVQGLFGASAKLAALGLAAETTAATGAAAANVGLLATITPFLIPIAAVIAALGLLYLAWKNLDKIKEIVGSAVKFVKDHLKEIGYALLLLTGPLGAAVILFIENFDKIKEVVGGVLNFFKELPSEFFNAALDIGESILRGLGKGLSAAGNFLGDIRTSLRDIFVDAYNWIINSLEGAFNWGLDLVDRAAGPLINIPEISLDYLKLAKGGIVTGPTLAMIGDNPSGREAVIPLDSSGNSEQFGTSITFGPGSVVVQFQGVVPSEQEAYTAGVAAGRGVRDEMARASMKRAIRVA